MVKNRYPASPGGTGGTKIDGFLRELAAVPLAHPTGKRGRLIFAMDATASRGPTWDRACQIQGEMFQETEGIGGIEVQMSYYRGFGEFSTSKWHSRPDELIHDMAAVSCLGGSTQIEKVLRHALAEGQNGRVNAVVFVGDCMEEDADVLCRLAGQLGVRGVPVFVFQEGEELLARTTFKRIARLSRGAWCSFDSSSGRQLRDLLGAVAVYAAGGRRALADFGKSRGDEVLRIATQLD